MRRIILATVFMLLSVCSLCFAEPVFYSVGEPVLEKQILVGASGCVQVTMSTIESGCSNPGLSVETKIDESNRIYIRGFVQNTGNCEAEWESSTSWGMCGLNPGGMYVLVYPQRVTLQVEMKPLESENGTEEEEDWMGEED
jgi:hypothetical protein